MASKGTVTTTIDKGHLDYQKRYAEADKKPQEIEHSVAINAHVVEEWIVDNLNVDDSGLDEEDKYDSSHELFGMR